MKDPDSSLHALVLKWATLAPEEVEVNKEEFVGHIWTDKDEHGDGDSNLWFCDDGLDTWGQILTGVLYHIAKRGLEARVSSVYSPGLMSLSRVGSVGITDPDTKEKSFASVQTPLGDAPQSIWSLAYTTLLAYLHVIQNTS